MSEREQMVSKFMKWCRATFTQGGADSVASTRGYDWLMKRLEEKANELAAFSAAQEPNAAQEYGAELDKLARFLMRSFRGEMTLNETVVDCAIRLLAPSPRLSEGEAYTEAARKWALEQAELGDQTDHAQGLSEYRLDAAEQGFIAGALAALAAAPSPAAQPQEDALGQTGSGNWSVELPPSATAPLQGVLTRLDKALLSGKTRYTRDHDDSAPTAYELAFTIPQWQEVEWARLAVLEEMECLTHTNTSTAVQPPQKVILKCPNLACGHVAQAGEWISNVGCSRCMSPANYQRVIEGKVIICFRALRIAGLLARAEAALGDSAVRSSAQSGVQTETPKPEAGT